MNAVNARNITTGRDHAALTATDDHGLALQRRVIPLLDGGKKRVTIDMGNGELIEFGMLHKAGGTAIGAPPCRWRFLINYGTIPANH
jgi:hypothetical protein